MSSSFFLYEPVYNFDRLFNQAFDARFKSSNGSSNNSVERHDNATADLRPRMDLHENAEANTVTATFELPGLTKENIHVDVHDGRLNISAESKISSEHEEGGYMVRERKFGKFARALQLPRGVKDEQIQAKMENGILTITFPKNTPEMAPKKIAVA